MRPMTAAERFATHPDRWWNKRTLTAPEICEAVVQGYLRGRDDEFAEWTDGAGATAADKPAPPAEPAERGQVGDGATAAPRQPTAQRSTGPKPKPGKVRSHGGISIAQRVLRSSSSN